MGSSCRTVPDAIRSSSRWTFPLRCSRTNSPPFSSRLCAGVSFVASPLGPYCPDELVLDRTIHRSWTFRRCGRQFGISIDIHVAYLFDREIRVGIRQFDAIEHEDTFKFLNP